MKQNHYFIDQTTRGNVCRLTLDFTSKVECRIACEDLNIAFPHAKHEIYECTQLIKQPELQD